jgi:hypothetical protein
MSSISIVQISSPSELPKATCREYAGVPASEAVTAFQRTGQIPGAIYQYGKRLFVFAIGHSDDDK